MSSAIQFLHSEISETAIELSVHMEHWPNWHAIQMAAQTARFAYSCAEAIIALEETH